MVFIDWCRLALPAGCGTEGWQLAALVFICPKCLPQADRREAYMPKVDYSRVTVRLGEAEAKKLAELARHTDRPVSNLLRLLIKQAATLPPETLLTLTE